MNLMTHKHSIYAVSTAQIFSKKKKTQTLTLIGIIRNLNSNFNFNWDNVLNV